MTFLLPTKLCGKSQNFEELGTISKAYSSFHPHNASEGKAKQSFLPPLCEGKLRPEGGSDLSKISPNKRPNMNLVLDLMVPGA